MRAFFQKNPREETRLFKDKRAQEMSASWGMEWFIKNIVFVLIFLLLVGAGLYFLIKNLTSY